MKKCTVSPTIAMKIYHKYDASGKQEKRSIVLKSDKARTEIPCNADGSIKWFDDSQLIKKPKKRDLELATRIMDALSDGYDDEEWREETEQDLAELLTECDSLFLGTIIASLCERIEELEG